MSKTNFNGRQTTYLEGMISKKGTEFEAMVQFNADKRYVEFLFDRGNTNQQTQSNGQNNQQNNSQEVPRTFRGKELDNEQYDKFKAGQNVYISGLTDKALSRIKVISR